MIGVGEGYYSTTWRDAVEGQNPAAMAGLGPRRAK